jgi:hypothetical protein
MNPKTRRIGPRRKSPTKLIHKSAFRNGTTRPLPWQPIVLRKPTRKGEKIPEQRALLDAVPSVIEEPSQRRTNTGDLALAD